MHWRRWTPAGWCCARTRRTCTRRWRTGSRGGCPAWASGSTPAARATTRSRAISGSTSRTACSRSTRSRSTWRRRCSPSPAGTSGCSGPDTPTSAGRCPRPSGSGPVRTRRGCSTRSNPSRRCGPWWTARRSAAPRATACRCRSGARPWRRRSASAGSTGTWPRCRGGGASSKPRRCSGACSSGHDLGRLAQDVILYSAEEFGYLVLPAELATGSSIMPHKRNPDLFELTRGRAAALEGDLAAVLHAARQAHRRLPPRLSAPQGAADARARPRRGDPRRDGRGAAAAGRGPGALRGGAGGRHAGDRRGDAARGSGQPVPDRLSGGRGGAPAGRDVRAAAASRLVARRRSTGGLGDLGLGEAAARVRRARRWGAAGAGQVRARRCSGWPAGEGAR